MVMSETHSEKRKFGKAGESSVNKKARREVSKKYGKFTEDCIPDGVFRIGDDVFVFASTYYDSVSVHIRRFKKYGKTYYPTPEGITLDPRWIEYIMRKKKVPESLEELPSGLFPPERHIQITIDMQSLAEFNKGYKYLLTCIDLFSKFAWAVPLKDKFGKSVKSGLEIIFKERKPKVLQTDAAGDGNISSIVKRTIDVGCYETMLDIISAVQLALPKNPNRFTIIYNKATKRVKINAVQGSSLHLENLGELLGFKCNAIIIGESLGIRRFLEKINDVANLGKWSNDEKVTILKLKLAGIAEEFFLSDPTHSHLTEYNDIARILIKRFEKAVPLSTRLQLFSSCIQGSSESVQEFAARINKLGTQIFQSGISAQNTAVRNANDQLLQSRFISGLRNDIRRFVLARDPMNLDESIRAALIEEQNMKLNQIANDERSGLSPSQTENSVISALTNKLEENNLRVGRLQEASSVTARKTGGEFFKRRETVFKCFYCGIQGHRQAE
ncbi:uncharacterized protein TNCV_626641 [Trichonephila clavipes]|nr:uncharacterized protein TNCV_626641 [Trichonephila clavipes]